MSHLLDQIEPIILPTNHPAIIESHVRNFNDDFIIVNTFYNNDVTYQRNNILEDAWFPVNGISNTIVQYSEDLPLWSKHFVSNGVEFLYVYHIMLTTNGETKCISVLDSNTYEYVMTTGESTIDKSMFKGIIPSGSFSRIGSNNYTTCCLVPDRKASAENLSGYKLDTYNLQTNQYKTINLQVTEECTIHVAKGNAIINNVALTQHQTEHFIGIETVEILAETDSMGIITIK